MGGLDLTLTPEERDRFLEEQRTLRLATVDDGGEPQVVPLWFVWLDGAVFFNTTLGNRSIRSVEARPRAAATVDDGEAYGELRGVTFRGLVERSDDDPRLGAVKVAFARKYFGGDPVPFDRWRGRAWFRLVPDHEASWDFRKIPEARERARGRRGDGSGVSTVRILLTGIGAEGRHGASPGERDAPQPFVMDLDLFVDVAGDDLEATADYRDLVREARSVVERSSFALLESLAEAVADAVAAHDRVSSVVATVRKPGAAGRLGVADVAAQAVRAEAEAEE